jgi:hypothetical protein
MIDLEILKNNPEEFKKFFSTFDWSKDAHKIGCVYSGSIAKNIHFGEDICKDAPVFHKKKNQPRDIDLGVYNEDLNWLFEMMKENYPNHSYGKKLNSNNNKVFKLNSDNIVDVITMYREILPAYGIRVQVNGGLISSGVKIYTNILTGYFSTSLPMLDDGTESKHNMVEFLGFSRTDRLPMFKYFSQQDISVSRFDQNLNTFEPNGIIQRLCGVVVTNPTIINPSLQDSELHEEKAEEDIDSYDEKAELVETKNDVEIVKIGDKYVTRIIRPEYSNEWFTKSIYKFGCPVSGRNVEIHITTPERTKNILSYIHGCNVNVTSLYTFIMGSMEWKRPKDIWFLELCRKRISNTIPLPKTETKPKSNSFNVIMGKSRKRFA